MLKYKVVTVTMDKSSIVELEDDAMPLNTFWDEGAERWKVVCLVPVEEEAPKEKPKGKPEEEPEGKPE